MSPTMPETTWSNQQKLAFLMRLPWSVRVETDPTDLSLFASVAEIPDALADAADDEELLRALWDSLYSSLSVRLEHGDPIRVPSGIVLPWDAGIAPPRARWPLQQDLRAVVEPTSSAVVGPALQVA